MYSYKWYFVDMSDMCNMSETELKATTREAAILEGLRIYDSRYGLWNANPKTDCSVVYMIHDSEDDSLSDIGGFFAYATWIHITYLDDSQYLYGDPDDDLQHVEDYFPCGNRAEFEDSIRGGFSILNDDADAAEAGHVSVYGVYAWWADYVLTTASGHHFYEFLDLVNSEGQYAFGNGAAEWFARGCWLTRAEDDDRFSPEIEKAIEAEDNGDTEYKVKFTDACGLK